MGKIKNISKIFFDAAGHKINFFTDSVAAQRMRGDMYDEKRKEILRKREYHKQNKEFMEGKSKNK